MSAGRLAKAQTVRFKRRGRKTVRLKLTARGRRTLAACGTRRRVTSRPARRRRGGCCGATCARSGTTSSCAPAPPGPPAPPEPPGFDVTTGCDFLDPSVCLQPWPNDYFTVPDGSTPTGRRLNLTSDAMPRNVAGKPIEPGDYNRNDGFGPGSPIHLRIPGLDNQAAFDRTGLVPETDISQSFDVDAARAGDRRRHASTAT